ncbi:MAG: PKD domain-containing protein [Candidatus Nanoarchaeia archaeon]|nr:PKD domain-containing protein [Candidatus Nanoarchaeia archaeon]
MAFVMIGGVSATIADGVVFTSPALSSYVHSTINVQWTNVHSYPTLTLQYVQGECNASEGWTSIGSENMPSTKLSSSWNTAGLDDGNYCLRLQTASLLTEDSVAVTVDNEKPIAKIAVTGNKIQYEKLNFYGNGSTDNNGIASYLWEFGDGSTSTEMNPTHSYLVVDDYTVKLTVTDSAGNKDSATKSITIADIPYEEPSTVFEAGIREMLDLHSSIDTGLTGTIECSVLPSSLPIDGLVLGESGSNCTFDWTNIPYSYRGLHELSIRVSSTEAATPKYFKVDITVYTWMAPLVVTNENYGWNMFSIPMMPADTDSDSVLANIKDNMDSDNVWQYDATAQKWKKTTKIVPGYAYRVKMKATDTLKGFGNIEGSQVPVVNGWNAIGHYGINSVSIDDALTSLTLGDVKFYDSILSSSSTFDAYQGYFLTAKFLPDTSELYTPSQSVINYILAD